MEGQVKDWDPCFWEPLKGFERAGDYSQFCVLESFWRIHKKENSLEKEVEGTN